MPGGGAIRWVEDCHVYRKAVEWFELFIEEDMPVLQKTFVGKTLAGNQLRCLDSIFDRKVAVAPMRLPSPYSLRSTLYPRVQQP
jgi:hypothetical protein